MLSLLELRVRERSELGKIAAQRRPVRAVPQLRELEVVARDWVEAGEGLVADPLMVLVLGAPLVLILPTQRSHARTRPAVRSLQCCGRKIEQSGWH